MRIVWRMVIVAAAVATTTMGGHEAAGDEAALCVPVAEHSRIDLGAVIPGTELTATFVLRNPCDTPVRILRAKPT